MPEQLFYAPICRVDAEKREVWSEASTELLGADGKVLGYEASVRAFSDWPGNVREQHDPKKAVGRAVHWEPQDGSRTILLGARISRGAEDTWQKVLDGTLRYFSVKGPIKHLETRPLTVNGVQRSVPYVTAYDLEEVSLVDRPGDSGVSPFTIIRAAEPTELVDEGELTPPDDLDRAATNHDPTTARHTHRHAPYGFAMDDNRPHVHAHEHGGDGQDDADHDHSHEGMHGVSRADDGDGKKSKPKQFADVPDDEWGDPGLYNAEGEYKYPMPDAAHARNAAARLAQNEGTYSSENLAKVRARIKAREHALGITTDDDVKRDANAAHEAGDVARLQQIADLLRQAIASEAGELAAGDADDLGCVAWLACALNDVQMAQQNETYEAAMAQRSAKTAAIERAHAREVAPPEENDMATSDELLELIRTQGEAFAAAVSQMTTSMSQFQETQAALVTRMQQVETATTEAVERAASAEEQRQNELLERVKRIENTPQSGGPYLRTEGVPLERIFPGELPAEGDAINAEIFRRLALVGEQADDPTTRNRAQLAALLEGVRSAPQRPA